MSRFMDKISADLNAAGYKKNSMKARNWLRDNIKNLNPGGLRSSLRQTQKNLKPGHVIGRMFFYAYYAKHQDTLPYWDRFPLVIPIETYEDGILGVNLHYLPPNLRAVLLNKLFEFASDKRYDENTRLKLSYSLLKGLSRMSMFRPCLKRYLFSQLYSRFIEVPADQWDIAIWLPVEQFVGASKQEVWKESRGKY